MGKIYDSSSLEEAMKKRTEQYQVLGEQFQSLNEAFQAIVDNTDLQGKGAENIKGFYQAQMNLIGDWQDLIEGLTMFFDSIPGRMGDADLYNNTKVTVPFLQEQLQSGSDSSRQMVDQQHSELIGILNSIRDILPLSSFSSESFKTNMRKADRKREETADAVEGLDHGYLYGAYHKALENLRGVSAGYDVIRSATSTGDGTIQPINFNQKIYDEHEVHDVREKVEENLDAFKYEEKKLKEFRIEKAKMEEEMAKIKAEQEKPAHEKIFNGVAIVAGEVSGVNEIIRATTGVDPVTGKKLTEAERIKAAALAAAGFIPIVGWGGRAAKGVYKGGKAIEGMVTADRALDAYKTTTGMQKLAQAEKGIYGLTVANSGYEFTSGRDMFGNKLTEEQRNNAMWESFGLVGSPFLARGVTKLTSKLPHNPAFVQIQINKAKQGMPSPANWVSKPFRNTFAKPEIKKPVVNNISKRTAPNASAQKADVSPPSTSIKKGTADSGAAPVNKVESKPQTDPSLGKKIDPVKEQEVRSQPKVMNGEDVPVVGPVKPEGRDVPKRVDGDIQSKNVIDDAFRKNPADPIKEILGSGRQSHAEKWDSMINEMEAEGVEVIYKNGVMAYSPSNGNPGQLVIDEASSIGALIHEYTHYLDDRNQGYPGMSYHFQTQNRVKMELNAYMREIEFAENIGRRDIANMLFENYIEERGLLTTHLK